jgi:hypothetical protein
MNDFPPVHSAWPAHPSAKNPPPIPLDRPERFAAAFPTLKDIAPERLSARLERDGGRWVIVLLIDGEGCQYTLRLGNRDRFATDDVDAVVAAAEEYANGGEVATSWEPSEADLWNRRCGALSSEIRDAMDRLRRDEFALATRRRVVEAARRLLYVGQVDEIPALLRIEAPKP